MWKPIFIEAVDQEKIEFIDTEIQLAPKSLDLLFILKLHASKYNKSKCLEWCQDKFETLDFMCVVKILKEMVEKNYLDTVRWLITYNKERWLPKHNIRGPFKVENVEILKLLREVGQPLGKVWPLSVKVAQYLMDNGVKVTKQHLYWAVGGLPTSPFDGRRDMRAHAKGLAEICKMYHKRSSRLKFTKEHVELGLQLGAVEFAQFVHENKIGELTAEHLFSGVRAIHLDLVKYIHEVVGIPMSDNALEFAIRVSGKGLEVDHQKAPMVEYIVQATKGKKWTRCISACECTFETIQWLLVECNGSNEWPILHECVRFGSVDVLSYLVGRTNTSLKVIEAALDNAISRGIVNVLEFLWSLAVPAWLENGLSVKTACKNVLNSIERGKGEYKPSFDRFIQIVIATEAQYP